MASILNSQDTGGPPARESVRQTAQGTPAQAFGDPKYNAISPGWLSDPIREMWDLLYFHCGQDITHLLDHLLSWLEHPYHQCVLYRQTDHLPGQCRRRKPHVNRASKAKSKAADTTTRGRDRARGRSSYSNRASNVSIRRDQGEARGGLTRGSLRGFPDL